MAAPSSDSFFSRDLRLYEIINSGMCISLAVSIDGKLAASHLESAIRRVYAIHPYMRMRILPAKDSPLGFRFMESVKPAINLRAESGDVSGNSWQARLNSAGSDPATNESSVSRWGFISSPDEKHHQLLWTVNHAGTDGIGIFSILDDLLEELGQIASGNAATARSPREFVDILALVPVDAIDYPAPNIPKHYMPAIRAPGDMDPRAPARILGTWYEFDEHITTRIIEESKLHGCTIQGSLSAATIVAMCQAQAKSYALPQDLVVLAPVNMRNHVIPPIDRKDSTCGSAGLTWSQHVTLTTTLWEIAKSSAEGVADAIATKQGLWWWATLSAGKPLPAPTVMCSSIGVTPIKKEYGKLVVKSIKLLGGAYGKATAGSAGIMTHAYTVNGRLNITFAYTSPPMSRFWAERFLATQVAVLEKFADGAAGDSAITSVI